MVHSTANVDVYIPGVAILHSFEVVRVSLVRSDGTLSHTIDSISLVGMELANAVPMDGSPIGLKTIGNMHSDIVTPAGFNQGPGVSVVEDFTGRLEITVRRDCVISDLQPVFSLNAWWPLALVISGVTLDASARVSLLSISFNLLVLAKKRLFGTGILEPAATIIGRITTLPGLQRRVFTFESI